MSAGSVSKDLREQEARLIAAQAVRIRELEELLSESGSQPGKALLRALDRLESALRIGHPQGIDAIRDLEARILRAAKVAAPLYNLYYCDSRWADGASRVFAAREAAEAAMSDAKPGGLR